MVEYLFYVTMNLLQRFTDWHSFSHLVLDFVVIIVTGQAVLYYEEPKFELVGARTVLLFALPLQIRASQPGIPARSTISDGE
jgi:hypothetical protein